MATSMFTNPYDAAIAQRDASQKRATQAGAVPWYRQGAVSGSLIGQDLGRNLGGMLGMQTPEQAKQNKIEEIMGQYGEGAKSYEQLLEIADSFRDANMLDLWKETMDMADNLTSDDTTRGKDIQKHADIIGCDWNDLTPDDNGLTCKQKALASYKETVRAGAAERGEVKFAEEAMKDLVEKNSALITNAASAVATIDKTNRVLDLLEKGELHTGMFAEFKTNISRVLAMAGSDVSSGYASRTQLLEALLGSDVFPMIKQLGIGARGLDTPAEREFLLKVMTGEKSMDATAIKELTLIRQRISEKIVEKYNAKVKKGGFDKYTEYTGEEVPFINLEGFKKTKVPKSAIEVWKDGKLYMFDKETGKMYLNGREVNVSQ